MRRTSFGFRLCTATALTGMLLTSFAPAMAQTSLAAPGPELAAPDAGAPLPSAGDPPARVGRVARIGGTVSFHTADATQWEAATLNEPVTSGNAFWTQPGASTDLEVGGTRIVLDQTSEFTVDQLDDVTFNATAAQGRIYLRVRNIQMNETTTIRTPRGSVVITAPGRYEIAVGDTETPTLVTVDEGAATIEGPGVNLSIGDHQSAQVTGTDNFNGIVVAEQHDPFLDGQIERDHPPRAFAAAPPPPVVQQMTGYEAVADTGVWDTTPEYGQVWYPPVEAGWVPYREGHWAFIAPWGWTWVDDAPWGFAPFHYGRWVEIGPRWGWIPVERGVAFEARPVYAPALVAFVGVGAGIAVGLGIGAAMGWIPLGPREVYHPPYGVSSGYFNRVNVTNVTNITNIRNVNTAGGNYVNARSAATVAPGSAFQNSQNLRGVAHGVPQGQVGGLQPLSRPNVTPTTATQGVSPGVAHSMNLPAGPGGFGGGRTAPGPSFTPHSVGAPVGGAGGAPALSHPGNVSAPVGGTPHGLPPITTHGAPPAPSQPHGGGFGGGTPQNSPSSFNHPQGGGQAAPSHPNVVTPQAPHVAPQPPQQQQQQHFEPRPEPRPAPQPAPHFEPRPEPRAEPRAQAPAPAPHQQPQARPEPHHEHN